MRRIILLFTISMLAHVIWAQSSDEQAIIALVQAETEAYDARDFDTWQDFWMHHENAMILAPTYGYEVFSWDNMVDSMKRTHFFEGAQPSKQKVVNSDHRISVMGNLAFATYLQERKTKRGKVTDVNREFRVLLKQDNRWRLMVVYASPHWEPTDNQANTSLRQACMALGQSGAYDRALALLKTGEELYPNDPWYINGQAMMYMKQGDKNQAKAHLERSLKVEKTPMAQRMLEDLNN